MTLPNSCCILAPSLVAPAHAYAASGEIAEARRGEDVIIVALTTSVLQSE